MRASVAAAAVALAVALPGCGENDRRAAVRDYLVQANSIQDGYAAEFARADQAFRAIGRGSGADATGLANLVRAETSLRSARGRLDALEPPVPAQIVHQRLLRVFDLSIGLAAECARLVRYQLRAPAVLAPLTAANRRLRSALRRASTPRAQARALRSFDRGVGRRVRELRALDVPRALLPTHASQVRRLQSTRRLTRGLRAAVLARDVKRVGRLLRRFDVAGGSAAVQRQLAERGMAQHNGRLKALARAQADLGRAQSRLERTL